MHNLTKIKVFRGMLILTYPLSLIFIYPIVQLLRKRKSNLFFFFDRYAIGGAQRVHLDILCSVQDIPKTVYFTRYSANNKLKHEFYSIPESKCADIHFWCDNLIFRLFSVHYFSFLVNKNPGAKVFSANSTFFYDMLPFLSSKIYKAELLHNFSYGNMGMEFFGLANYRYLDKRLVIDAATLNNILEQYQQYQVKKGFADRIELIEFGVDIPPRVKKEEAPPLQILYAGRGTYQKRIWLLNRVAEHFILRKHDVQFVFAGPMSDELSDTVKANYIVYGEIGERDRVNSLYEKAHVIILTSQFEGFPVVVKEGMSYGCIPLVPALPGLLTHLSHLQNAFIIDKPENEAEVVAQAIRHIETLIADPLLLSRLSENCLKYASRYFNRGAFMERYRALLLS